MYVASRSSRLVCSMSSFINSFSPLYLCLSNFDKVPNYKVMRCRLTALDLQAVCVCFAMSQRYL